MKNTTQSSLSGRLMDDFSNRTAKKWVVVGLSILFLFTGYKTMFGQYYTVATNCTETFRDISGESELAVDPVTHCVNVTLPFSFEFFGVNYTNPSLRVSEKGYVLFNKTTGELADDNASLPEADTDVAPDGALFPLWDDMIPDNFTFLPSISVSTQGIAPNRTYIVQWSTMYKVDPAAADTSEGSIDFQMIFYESSNLIRYVYGDTFFGGEGYEDDNDGGSATIGLQRGSAPNTYYSVSFNQPILETVGCILFTPSETTAGCTMACAPTNISIPANCQPVLIASDLLTSSFNCSSSFIIQLLRTPTGPVLETGVDSVTADGIDILGNPYVLLNQTYVIKIMENITSGSPQMCWNYHTFEDYLPPAIICRASDTIPCYLPAALYDLENYTDCSGDVTAHVTDSSTYFYSCTESTEFIARVIRSYYLTDGAGNPSETCTDTLYLEYPSLDSITGPDNVTNIECTDSYATDVNGHPHPSFTGVPTIGEAGVPLYPNELGLICNLSTTYTDQVVPAGCNTKILRNWTVYFWSCEGEDTWSTVQTIMINDNTPPDITAPADVTLNTGSNCQANYFVPPATITDNCDHLGTVTVIHPNGLTPQNGGFWVNGLSVGTHNIIYTVNDGCGHTSSDTTVVTVSDNQSPYAVCKNVIVSLTNTGFVRMNASSVNNNSHDNGCGPVTYKVRRMLPDCNGDGNDQSSAFADYIDFYCCDLPNNPIQVILEVTDAGGLKNTCMAEVTVQNKNVPVIEFTLPNLTVPCNTTYDVANLALTFGKYVTDPSLREDIIIDGITYGQDGLISGICVANVTELTPNISISDCGYGTIIRTFRITDGGGYQRDVTQTITFVAEGAEITAQDFYPPQDYTITSGFCLPVEVVDVDFGGVYRPRLIEGTSLACHNLMYTFNDKVYTGVPDVCFKVIRTWQILDWCLAEQHGTQYAIDHAVTFSHIIKVMNTTAPEFDPHADVFIEGTSCTGGSATVSASATDDCPASGLKYDWEVDFNFNNTLFTWDADGNGSSFTINWPIGTHRVHFSVVDGCGNSDDQFFDVTVTYTKEPTPVMHNLVIDLMANLTVQVPARLFNSNSTGACPNSYPLYFAYSNDPADSVRIFDCSYGVDVPFDVDIYVIDANGYSDFATPTLTLNDNIVPCPDNNTFATGQILTEKTEGIPDVEVFAQQNMMVHTDVAGSFGFDNMLAGHVYTIQPEESENPTNGVTTADLIKIQNHIIGKKNLETPYKIIASDVTEDDKLNILDVTQIRSLLLGKIDQFSSGKSWKFIDDAYQFIDATQPLKEDYPTQIAYTAGTDAHLAFVGVKLGDVDGDYTLNFNEVNIESRSMTKLTLEDILLEAGKVYEIPFKVNDGNVEGIQFSLNLDREVQIAGVSNGRLLVNEDNFNRLGDEIRFSVSELNDREDETLFTLALTVNRASKLSDILHLDQSVLRSELYDGFGNKTGFDLTFKSVDNNFDVSQNRPNPFNESTLIDFTLGQDDDVKISIYDLSGRILFTQKGFYPKGRHNITIDGESLGATGVFMYEVTTSTGSVSKKMVRLH